MEEPVTLQNLGKTKLMDILIHGKSTPSPTKATPVQDPICGINITVKTFMPKDLAETNGKPLETI